MKPKDFFKPEDFEALKEYSEYIMAAADIANEKLNALIESWPAVWGIYGKGEINVFTGGAPQNATHKARLAFIEEIPAPEPCKHEPVKIDYFGYGRPIWALHHDNSTICAKCGVKLVATWKEKK